MKYRHLSIVLLFAALVAALAGPAAASAAVPNPSPNAKLTGASITFTTNDDDKDGDSSIVTRITNSTANVVAVDGAFYGHFDDRTVNGPYELKNIAGVPASTLRTGHVEISMSATGNDTWRFDYSITLRFSDGTAFTFGERAKTLTQDYPFLWTTFAMTTQVAVPDVIGASQAAAISQVQAAGLTVGTVTQRADSTCDHIGQVLTETPGAGTLVNTGSRVDLIVGVKPKTPCP